MLVHQPVASVFGILLTGGLVMVLGMVLCQAIAKPEELRQNVGMVCLSIAVALPGLRALSEAFDLRSQWSHRTETITTVTLLMQLALSAFYVIERRRKRVARRAGR